MPLRGSRGKTTCLFSLLVAPGAPGLWLHPSSLCLPRHTASFSVCLSPFLTPVIRFRTHLTIQDSPISTSLIHPHARDSFQIRPHSQGANIRIRTYLWGEGHHLIYDGAQESIIFKWISKVIWMHWELPTSGSNCLANSSSSECLACVHLVSLIGLSLLLGTGALVRIQHTYDREVTQGCP